MVKSEIKLIDSQISSIVPLEVNQLILSLNLHHNTLRRIDGLRSAANLQYLDLSSNFISQIDGLDSLLQLRTLNLSSNCIGNICGLKSLKKLVNLDLSFNLIENSNGLQDLQGPEYSLAVIHLQGNKIQSMKNVMDCARNLLNLRQLTLMDSHSEHNNPLCESDNYRQTVLAQLPHLTVLDNIDRSNRRVQGDILSDIPELAEFLDCVSIASTTHTNEHDHVSQGKQSCPKVPSMKDCTQNAVSHSQIQPNGTTNNNPQCTSPTTTERRLVNLENQLTSLVASQVMRLNQPQDVGNNSSPLCSEDSGKVELDDSPDELPNRGSKRITVDAQFYETKPLETMRTTGVRTPGERSGTKNLTQKLPSASKQQAVSGQFKSFVEPVQSKQSLPEDHHPGAPKRNGQPKAAPKPSSQPLHGRPIFPRRPSSTPGSSADHVRVDSTGSFGVDPHTVLKPTMCKYPNALRRSDNLETKSPKPSLEDVAGKTLGQILRELDSERGQRKQTEKVCQDLTERILRLESTAIDESKALDATQKLKLAFTSERRSRLEAESRSKELGNRLTEVNATIDAMRTREEAEKSRIIEETSRVSTRIAELSKDYQDAIARAERAEKKLDEVQCRLKAHELEFKDLLTRRFTIDSPELSQLISARIGAVEAKYELINKALNEKLEENTSRFHALEEEFRLALRIEAERYGELYKTAETLKQKLTHAETQSRELEQREESARQKASELTTAIKEHEIKTLNDLKSHLLAQHNYKDRISQLEALLHEAQDRVSKTESIRLEENKLKAELSAQQSLVMGLRAERRNWSEELAKQSAALSQDCGRLEAKIEAQTLEIASLNKQLEEETDAVKIKTKIIDDQTDSISQLKKNVTEHQSEVKKIQDEYSIKQRQLTEQLAQAKRENEDHLTKIERLLARKEELKGIVSELQSRVEELEAQNNSLNQRWSERTTLLDKLESQLDQMRRSWEQEQQALMNERDAAKEQVDELQLELERIDSGYRQQLAVAMETKERAVSAVRDEAEQVRSTCESRVAGVEAEMRAVLLETESTKNAMEQRLRKISAVLCNPLSFELIVPTGRTCHSSQSHQYPPIAETIERAYGTMPPNRFQPTMTAVTPPPMLNRPHAKAGDTGGHWIFK